MNLLKIFTYSGIIEVFIIPHIMPCVINIIPPHIVNMIQLGVSFVTDLLPQVTINVDSGVMLKVWKDENEAGSDLTPSIDSKNGNGSSSGASAADKSDNSSNGGCSRRLNEGNQPSSSNTNGGKSWPSKLDDDDDCVNTSFSGSASNDCEFKKQADGMVMKARTPAYISYPSRYVCSVEENPTAASSEHLDRFCRSCSVEYQVKTPVGQTNAGTQACAMSPKPYQIQDTEAENIDVKNPQFHKSCSLEYVTKLDYKNDTSINGSKTIAENSSGQLSNKKSKDFRTFTCDKNSADLIACKLQDFTITHNAYSENLEAKAVYFGRNYKNL